MQGKQKNQKKYFESFLLFLSSKQIEEKKFIRVDKYSN